MKRLLRRIAERALGIDGALLIVPTFSSNLVRRIARLRSRHGLAGSGRRSALGIFAAGAIATIGAGTIALRGAAEQDAAAPEAVSKAPGAFEAEPVNLFFMGGEGLITVMLRPHAMAQREELKPLIDTVGETILENLGDYAKGDSSAQFYLDNIDFIAYQVRTLEEGDEDACNVAIRFVDPTPIAQWMLDHVPGAESVTDGSLVYVRVRQDDAAEPSMMLAQRDDRTVVLSDKVVGLQRMVKGEATGASDGAGNLVGGGLAMIAVDGSKIPGGYQNLLADWELGVGGVVLEESNPLTTALTTIYEEAKAVRIGLDLDPATHRVMVRAILNCTDDEAAQRVRGCVELYLAFAKEYVRVIADPAMLDAVAEEDRLQIDAVLLVVKLVADATVELRPQQDETVDVFVEMSGEVPKSIMAAVQRGEALRNPAGPVVGAADEDIKTVPFIAPPAGVTGYYVPAGVEPYAGGAAATPYSDGNNIDTDVTPPDAAGLQAK